MDHRGDTGLDPDRGDGPPTASGSRPRHSGGRHCFEDRQPGQPVYRPELPGHDTRGWEPADEWDTGQWQWGTDTGEWQLGDLAELDPDGEDQDDHRARHRRPETFWEGIRLAGDDPRWMPTPASAPRSPEFADDADRSAVPEDDPTGQPAAAHRRRSRFRHPALYTAAWYVVPVLILFVWVLTRDDDGPAGCITGAGGRGCESERAEAVASVASVAPRLGVALAASVVAALMLCRMHGGWRATSVSLAAALIGGGFTTAFFHLTGG